MEYVSDKTVFTKTSQQEAQKLKNLTSFDFG